MSDPVVTVIVPCHDDEDTVAETLRSLRRQTYSQWEAIVVNDGSTDDSPEIISAFTSEDHRIRRIDQTNQGLGAARNAGFRVGRGRYVNFLDADDVLLPSMLGRLVRALERRPALGVVHCGWIRSDPTLSDLSWVASCSYENPFFHFLAHHNAFPCHAALVCRDVVAQTGGFDASLRHCHDWDLWLRVARLGVAFSRVKEPLVIYRMRSASLSRNPFSFFAAGTEVIRRGHASDSRLVSTDPRFRDGCKCDARVALRELLRSCVAFALAQGDAKTASQLVSSVPDPSVSEISPETMHGMLRPLWFGCAIPQGQWERLWGRVGQPLLEFLLDQEERLNRPGLAVACVLSLVNWRAPGSRLERDAMAGRELLRLIGIKVHSRLWDGFSRVLRKIHERSTV